MFWVDDFFGFFRAFTENFEVFFMALEDALMLIRRAKTSSDI